MGAKTFACILLLPLLSESTGTASTASTAGRDKLKQWHRSISDMSYDGCWSDDNRIRYITKGDNNGVGGLCGEEIFRVVDCGSKGARWDYNYKVNYNYMYLQFTIYITCILINAECEGICFLPAAAGLHLAIFFLVLICQSSKKGPISQINHLKTNMKG